MVNKVNIDFNYSKSKYKSIVFDKVQIFLLKKYIKYLCKKNKSSLIKDISINYNFISKSEQIKMNREFKDHNYNTDILTFNLSETDCELTGDVYISLKQVKKNSERFKTDFISELNRVLIHGFLHLYGYNDELKEEQKQMRKQEDKYLNYLKRKFHVEH